MNTKTTSAEYETFQSHFDSLSTGVSSSVLLVARKAFERNLITAENMSSAMNEFHSEMSRSSSLMFHILNKVNENKDHFYTFISILKSVSTLGDLADRLAKECSESSSEETALGPLLDNPNQAASFEGSSAVVQQSDSAILSFQCQCGSNCTLETCLSGKCRGQLENAFPYLDMKQLSEKDKEKLIRRLVIDANKMITMFEELVYDTFESLNNQETPIEKLRSVVLTFGPHSLPRPYKQEHKEELSNAESVNDVHAFLVKHNYISFFNYRILQGIIRNLGEDSDRKRLDQYVKKYREFCKRKVFEVPSSALANSSPELDKTLVVKVREKAWFGANRMSPDCEFTMEDVYAIEDRIATEIGIDPENILLKDVGKGCIQLCFVVLSDVQNVKLEGLLEYGIVQIDQQQQSDVNSNYPY